MIDGVCGGIAEYFDVDPTIVRTLMVLSTLLGGSGFILYLVGMIVMPVNPEHLQLFTAAPSTDSRSDKKRFWGVFLILLGALILITNLGWFAAFRWWHLSWGAVFPVILILLGIAVIAMRSQSRQPQQPHAEATAEGAQQQSDPAPPRELRRSIGDRKLFGVCGGLASYFGIDSTIVRILFICLVVASLGWGLLLYIILSIVMPEEKPTARSV